MSFNFFINIILIFWFLKELKNCFFWLYLWQVKEYHLGRLIDHFRTEKGKKIFFNRIIFLKILIFSLLLLKINNQNFVFFLLGLLGVLYFLEVIKFFYDWLKKELKKPVWTAKSIFLFLNSLFLILFLVWGFLKENDLIIWILTLDLFSPFIFSGIVLIYQPFTYFLRLIFIKRAKNKIIQLKKENKNLVVIGITGSYGKTSTKEFLSFILSQKYGKEKVLKTEKNQNSEMGISRCVLKQLTINHNFFVCEMGAYNKGGIRLLSEIVSPQIGIVTGINEQHLALFGSLENLISAEGGKEMLDALPKEGIAIFNWDNEYIKKLEPLINKYSVKIKKIIFCSQWEKKDLWAEEIKIEKQKFSFILKTKSGEECFLEIPLAGGFHLINILMAITCAKELGLTLKEIVHYCQQIPSSLGSIRVLKSKIGCDVVDSSYSANYHGVLADLDYLRLWSGKKIIIMPCLIELGNASPIIHFKIGEKIAKVCDLAIITAKERLKEIKEGALSQGMAKENIIYSEKPQEIYKIIKENIDPQSVILLEGRVSPKIYEIFKN